MLIYLKPLSIFPELHSDTLFGAITYAINELYPEKVQDMLDAFKEEPPFILSSTFPFIYKEDKKIRFYPKIITKSSSDEKADPQIFKKYKKVKYVEEDIFLKMIKGDLEDIDILKDFENYNVKKESLLLKEDLDYEVNFSENIIPNNSVNRVSNETEGIFYTSGKQFKNMGLFFLLEFNDEEYIPLIKSAMRFLRDRGFGRDITNGKGHFEYEIDERFSINEELNLNDSNLGYFITLSRFIPSKSDLEKIDEYSTYEIGSKRGKSPAGEIRKQVRFFNEGSKFPNYNKYYGMILESGKDSPSVEYGFAFPLKCYGNMED